MDIYFKLLFAFSFRYLFGYSYGYFQWFVQPKTSVCLGDSANLVWNYTSNETTSIFTWEKLGSPNVLVATIFANTFSATAPYNGRVNQTNLGNAAILMSSVTANDSGTYGCTIQSVYSENITLVVAETPSGLPFFNKTEKSLTCNPPQNLGSPNVETKLKFQNGTAKSALTTTESGTYQCCINGDAVRCLSSASNAATEACVNETLDKPSEGKLTPGAIAGIVIGVVAGLIIIFVFVYFCIIKKKKGCTHCPCCKQDVKTPGNTCDNEDFASNPNQNPLAITNTTTKPPVKLQPLATKDKNRTPLDKTEEQTRKKKKKKQKQVHNKEEIKVVNSDSENTGRKQDDTTGTMNENHQPYGNGKQETLTIFNVDNEKNKTGFPYEKHEKLTAIHIDNEKNKTGIAYEKHEKPTAINNDNENNKTGIAYEKHEKLTAIHIDNENNKTGIAYEKHEKPTSINIDNEKNLTEFTYEKHDKTTKIQLIVKN